MRKSGSKRYEWLMYKLGIVLVATVAVVVLINCSFQRRLGGTAMPVVQDTVCPDSLSPGRESDPAGQQKTGQVSQTVLEELERTVKWQEKSIEELRERYSDLLTELGIWMTVLTGVMAVVTIILEFMFRERAEERYQKLENKMDEEARLYEELKLKEKYNHACSEVWGIHSVLRLSTPMVKNVLADMMEAAVELLEFYDEADKVIEETKKEELFKRKRMFWLQMYRTLSYILPIMNRYKDLNIRTVVVLNSQINIFFSWDSREDLTKEEKDRKLSLLGQDMLRNLRALPTILRAQNKEHEIQQTGSGNVPVDPGKEENRK